MPKLDLDQEIIQWLIKKKVRTITPKQNSVCLKKFLQQTITTKLLRKAKIKMPSAEGIFSRSTITAFLPIRSKACTGTFAVATR